MKRLRKVDRRSPPSLGKLLRTKNERLSSSKQSSIFKEARMISTDQDSKSLAGNEVVAAFRTSVDPRLLISPPMTTESENSMASSLNFKIVFKRRIKSSSMKDKKRKSIKSSMINIRILRVVSSQENHRCLANLSDYNLPSRDSNQQSLRNKWRESIQSSLRILSLS